jgi:hypothetical protein
MPEPHGLAGIAKPGPWRHAVAGLFMAKLKAFEFSCIAQATRPHDNESDHFTDTSCGSLCLAALFVKVWQ